MSTPGTDPARRPRVVLAPGISEIAGSVTTRLPDLVDRVVQRILAEIEFYRSFGQTCGLNAAVGSGACLTLLPRFDPGKALEVIQRDEVTVFEGVPTMYVALLNHPRRGEFDVGSLRVCVSGGAALPLEVLRGFEDAFGCMILEGYGLSETSPVASFNHPDRERKPGSIGTPIKGVEMRVVDPAARTCRPVRSARPRSGDTTS